MGFLIAGVAINEHLLRWLLAVARGPLEKIIRMQSIPFQIMDNEPRTHYDRAKKNRHSPNVTSAPSNPNGTNWYTSVQFPSSLKLYGPTLSNSPSRW